MEQQPRAPDGGAARMSWESIESFIEHMEERGCAQDTLKTYRRGLLKLYRFLPADKLIYRGTLEQWRDEMLGDYTARTANVNISAANSYLEYLGAREFQLTKPLPPPENSGQPEITRAEYLRMLERAREDGNERAYLLTKVFACVGITVQELPCVTAEAVAAGRVDAPSFDGRPVKLPEALRRELRGFMERGGIRAGPVFVTRSGRSLNRTTVTECIQRLACAAKIDPGKGNPRCLRKLCQSEREKIALGLLPLAERAYEQLIDSEQSAIGWNNTRTEEE